VTRRSQKRLALSSLPVVAAAGLLLGFAVNDDSAAGGTTGNATSTTSTTAGSQSLSAPTTTQVNLTVTPADANRTLDFGLARSSKSATFHFTASPPLTDDRKFAYISVDLIDAGGKSIDSSNVTSAAGLLPDSGGHTITVKLSVDPKDAKPGRYKGEVEIQGTELATVKKGTLTSILDSRSGWDYGIAFGVILFGVLLGAIVKYLSETGSKRGRLRRRLRTLDDMLVRLGQENFPYAFREKLTRAHQQLADGQTADAETAINDLWGKLDAVEGVATSSKQIRGLFKEQLGAIEEMISKQTPEVIASKLRNTVTQEERLLEHDIDSAWDSSGDSGSAERQKHAGWFDGYFSFLAVNVSTDATEWGNSPLKDIVPLYEQGDFEAAEAMRKKPTEEGAHEEVAAATGGATITAVGETLARRGSQRGWWQRRRRARQRRRQLGAPEGRAQRLHDWFDDHAEVLLWVLTPIVVAGAGLLYVYATDTGFDSSDPADWGKLAAWGFVGQISGTTLLQAFNIGRQTPAATT
jgi:hypothetical protein